MVRAVSFISLVAVLAAGNAPESIDPFLREVAYPAAQISYCDVYRVSDWSAPATEAFPNAMDYQAHYNTTHGVQSYCAYEPDNNMLIFSFADRQDVSQWISNVDFHRVEYPNCDGCSVHAGFRDGYHDATNPMLACYGRLRAKYPGAKSLVTGHGLGGALTGFFVVDLFQIYGHRADYHVTFGSPRVGNVQFVNYLDSIGAENSGSQKWRVVHHKDIVTHLPTADMGFTHMSTELWYNDDMSGYEICPEQEQRDCSWKITPMGASLADHGEYFGRPAAGCEAPEGSRAARGMDRGRRRLKDRLFIAQSIETTA